MTMKLLVIRHGQSEADLLNVMEGRADFSLTDEGRLQAQRMASWVKENYRIDKIYASPLKRAAGTAEFLIKATGAPVVLEEELMEWQNGLLAGLPREEAEVRYPAPPEKYPHTALYGCESMLRFRFRAETVLSKIIHENPDLETIAVITHGGMINMLFRSFLQLPVKDDISITTGDTGIHRWDIEDGRRRVVFANRLVHLGR